MSDNLKLWDAVCKTDPKHTKKVNQRGGFTAIDAHYQIQTATEMFGPIGIGWGYDCEYIFQSTLVICLVTFWHGDRLNKFGPIAGCAEMLGKKTDSDAPKKAMTDGITKALSHIGFNSDVFLGKYDDNKYIKQMEAEFAEPVKPNAECLTEYQAADANKKIALWDSYSPDQQAHITRAFS